MIALRDVHKVYRLRSGKEVRALDGLSLDVAAGSIHGIVGTSGAGKSTLVRCLTSLERPTSGHVSVAGQDMTALSSSQLREARRRIGMVFQRFNLFPHMTALENVMEAPVQVKKMPKDRARKRGIELLERVGLGDRLDHYPSQLSGGTKQRARHAPRPAAGPPARPVEGQVPVADVGLLHEGARQAQDVGKIHGPTLCTGGSASSTAATALR